MVPPAVRLEIVSRRRLITWSVRERRASICRQASPKSAFRHGGDYQFQYLLRYRDLCEFGAKLPGVAGGWLWLR